MKSLIVSFYDSGYYWSFMSGNKIYDRCIYKDDRIRNKLAKKLADFIERSLTLSIEDIGKVIAKENEKIEIILCINGHIEKRIYKGGE